LGVGEGLDKLFQTLGSQIPLGLLFRKEGPVRRKWPWLRLWAKGGFLLNYLVKKGWLRLRKLVGPIKLFKVLKDYPKFGLPWQG